MFEDIHEIAENSAYLKAVEEKDVSLQMLEELPPYDQLGEFEKRLREEGKIQFKTIFHEPTGYYLLKCFLISDYAGDKAVFVRDVETYQNIRFESARKRVARMLYERFVSTDSQSKFPKHSSIFDLIGPGIDRKSTSPDPDEEKNETELLKEKQTNMLQIGETNPIGVYGPSIPRVKLLIDAGQAPKNLFDEILEEVYSDLHLDVFPRFLKSRFYRKYIRTKAIEHVAVTIKDFKVFRVLGRGGFGKVHACRKANSGALYAEKCISKKLVKVKNALSNVMEERDVLTLLDSRFVTNLKYALQDEKKLYLIMDLMLGGDLKFHLINAGRFSEERARFHAAEVLLGLEHIHSHNIIYRDMKLENVLLDHNGHSRISDLGLAVITKSRVKGYAGTPGYTAPEMIRNQAYGPEVDLFSFGVMVYRMMCGSKPFRGRKDRDLDKAVIEKEARFPPEIFSPEATSLLKGLMEKVPSKRLGYGPNGMRDIKEHPFFKSIDWGLLEAGYVDPPFVPNKDVNAAPMRDIGEFDDEQLRGVRLSERFRHIVNRFSWVNTHAIQEEMVAVMEKADSNTTFEKFAPKNTKKPQTSPKGCCTVL